MFQLNKVKIQRGDDINFFLIMLKEDGDPFQCNGATAVTLEMKTTGNTILQKPALQGFNVGTGETITIYSFGLNAAETASLNAGDDQDVCVKINFGPIEKNLVVKKAFDVGDLDF